MAITSATNFTVQANSFFGNSSFIGARGPNCSQSEIVPTPGPFIIDTNTTKSISVQSSFVGINDGDSLTCVLPPNGGDFWPFGLNPSNSTSTATNSGSHSSTAAIVAGIIGGLILCGLATWIIRRWMLRTGRSRTILNRNNRPYLQRLSSS